MIPLFHKTNQHIVLELIQMMRPRIMRNFYKIRMGNDFDGGYVLPSNALNCDSLLSIGIGTNVSFDLMLADRGVHVLQLDHTVEGPPQHHPNFHFIQRGWGATTQDCFMNFEDIYESFLQLKPVRSILKFDIEGAEYEAIPATDIDFFEKFEIIVCEIHDLDRLSNPKFTQIFTTILGKLAHHHVPIHLHANNYGGVVLVEGVPIPKVLEITFLHKQAGQFGGFSSDPIPGPLDTPNCPVLPDICMNPF